MSAYAALVGLKNFFVSKTEATDISNATFCFAKYVCQICTIAIEEASDHYCSHCFKIEYVPLLVIGTSRLVTAVLIGCSILTTSKQFFGDPIHCHLDTKHLSLKVGCLCGSEVVNLLND